jgi:drug/metabolite transporter (DMT)-like permease
MTMTQRLTPSTALLLTIPPLLWAGNAVVGRMVNGLVPPITLNFLRWALAFLLLLPLAAPVLRPGSGLWSHWRRYAVLGLLGVGCYNALQYLALKTSTPLNVTLVAASSPVWMLGVGALFFGQRVTARQLLGAVLSIAGVLVVLARGDWQQLLRMAGGSPGRTSSNWAAFLLAQIVFGLGWSGLFAGGEWALTDAQIHWGWPLVAALAYVAVGPAIIAYRCWGMGVQRAGPSVAGFFSNLTPLFAALMSAAFLQELPHLYHGIAFALIVGGIVVSSRR